MTEAELAEALPRDLQEWALFIDVDGTLIDLAATPSGILIPAELPIQLSLVWERTGGAMALVTGRSIASVDAMFAPYRFTVAGMHGYETRIGSGHVERREIDGSSLNPARQELEKLAAKWPGLIVEDKGLAIAVHFRLVPEAAEAVDAAMVLLQERLGEAWKRQNGKMVVELHPAGTDKGGAVSRFMKTGPFLGKKPLVLGDDLTDEAMFHFANSNGGRSVRVGDSVYESAAVFKVASAGDVRRWIGDLALA
jgi:trehalose 6-phosphate phosphatase